MTNGNVGQPPNRTILYQTEFFEVVSIEWTNESSTELHDHGWSQCSVLIEEGTFEDTLNLGWKTEIRCLEAGQALQTPIGAKHAIRCLSSKGKTCHIYAPRLSSRPEKDKFHSAVSETLKRDLRLDTSVRTDSLQKILKSIRDESISTHSPHFMNQLFSGVSPQMILAEEIITQTKTTLATQEASPVFSAIESEVITELGKKIGWSEDSIDGASVPGGSAANFMALHCARQRRVPEVKRLGMTGERFKVFVSSESHYSFKKAAVALGLGTESVLVVPVDQSGKMDILALDSSIERSAAQGEIPLLVCATAGTTVFGAFDPLNEIAKICEKHQIWLHVDGAWGGPALFSKKMAASIRGVGKADSFTFDAHKLFGAGLTCSFLLTRHKGLLLEANDVSGGAYLFHIDDPEIDRGKASWQCGRRADAVSFWAIWKSLGSDGLERAIDRLITLREDTVLWAKQQPRLELVCEPEYLNVCLRVAPPQGNDSQPEGWSKVVREKLKDQNFAMVNYSANTDGTFLRLILAHPFLEFKHVQEILEYALGVR